MQATKALLLSNMLSSTESIENAEIASFNASCVSPLDITIDIDPVQDLHGYDNPWPAGGGKNKINYLACIGIGTRNGTDSLYGDYTSISGNELTISLAYGNNGGILKGIGTFPLNTGDTVTISGNCSLSNATTMVVGIANYNGGGTNTIRQNITPSGGKFSVTLAAGSDYPKTGIFLQAANANGSLTVSDVMVELGSTATDYAPYSNVCPISGRTKATISHSGADTSNPTEYEIPFSTEVYGGTLNVETGELVVDRAIDVITKNGAWYSFSTGTGNASAFIALSQATNVKYVEGYAERNGAISSTGKEAQNYWVTARQNEVPLDGDMCFAYSSGGQVRFHRTDVNAITDLATFKDAFPDTEICYPLATPITLTLDPVEIRSLLGDNNVWADTGNVSVRNITCNADFLELLLKTKLIGEC